MQWSSVCIVRTNAAALSGRTARLADEFLDRFVRLCPELSRLLTWNREQRQHHLLGAFTGILNNAGHPQALSARLLGISAANERMGVTQRHYELGREVLFTLIREYNGPNWTDSLAHAWEELLDHILIHLSPPESFEEALAA